MAPEIKLITKDRLLSPERTNIAIITLTVLTLNELIILKRSSETENKTFVLIKLIGMMVLLAFIRKSTFKFLILIEMTIYPLRYLILNSSKDKDKLESLKFIVAINTLGSIPFIIFVSLRDTENIINYTKILFSSNIVSTIVLTLFLIKTPIFLFHL